MRTEKPGTKPANAEKAEAKQAEKKQFLYLVQWVQGTDLEVATTIAVDPKTALQQIGRAKEGASWCLGFAEDIEAHKKSHGLTITEAEVVTGQTPPVITTAPE